MAATASARPLGKSGTAPIAPDEPRSLLARGCFDERLLDIAETLVGPNIALFNASYFCKAPRNGSPVLWHQDRWYWPIKSDVVTLWLAIDDSTPENGCLRVIPGSQYTSLTKLIERPH